MANVVEDKKKALDAAIAKLEKDFGKGTVMKLGDSSAHVNVETVPTGCLSLDLALGLGGVPKGRVIEVYGPESSGKTTVALHMIAEVQKRGGIAGFVDAEHALDPVYAKNIGVDIDELYISQPDSGDQALEIAETMVRSNAIDIIVIDSVAALVPRQEIEGDMGDSHVGLQARLMSQALRKLTPVISKSNCVVIFINQLREKVGVMFGNPETTTGGRALKFYASVRMDVRRIETLKQSGEMVGNRTRIKIVKNKIAPPFKEAEFDIMFGKGISRSGDILDLAAGIDIIKKSGSWYAYEGEKIGQGRENAKAYLESNPQVMEAVEKKVREHYNLEGADKSEASDDLKLKPKEKASGKTSDKGSVKGAGKTSEKASDEEAGKTGAISEESVVKAGEVTEQAAAKAEEKKSRKSTVKAEL
ncbi:MAG: recombinase RecA [Ruminococcus sp.]|nr:recombinase RecA [Ruminococcus sp.]